MKATTFILSAFSALALAAQPFGQDAAAPNTDTNKPAPAAPDTAALADAPAAAHLDSAEKGLLLNFRGVSLDQVLNYMSEAAGFIINVVPGTDVKGKVDVWSNQPLNKEEAVQLLNTILHDHGLAAIRTGRTLSIINRNDAKTNKDVPVKVGNKPEKIERSDEMVTQIIPIKYANAAALVQNLQPLLPEYAQNGLSANESGNALILTATQTDVRRMTEIVSALDTAISSVSEIKVFLLKYADAKDLATSIKELFTPPAQQQNQNQGGGRGQFFQQMFGGGGGPGGPGGGRGGGGGNNPARGNTSATAARVVAVADERSNSLIVAAAQDAMPEIERLVAEVDVAVDDVTEIRVFPLMNSDPSELADILSQLFPDPTTSSTANNQRFGNPRFGGGFGGFNRGAQNAANTSERAKKQGRVTAVPDARTGSLIVTAARDLMPQIEAMIKRLDASRARHQVVKVYTIENADVTQVEQVVRDMFDRSNNGRNNNNQTSALASRQQQNIQNQNNNMTSGFGGTGGAGAGGLGSAFGR